jgi:hypothetical protein
MALTKNDEEPESELKTVMFSGRTIYVFGSLQVSGALALHT